VNIPVLNIYYLLAYAWDRLDESDEVSAGISDYKDALNLFARVLVNGCNRLFKKGLDRDYVHSSEIYFGIKGKINFASSINGNHFDQGKAVCEFDEFQYNILQNEILKATLLRLSKNPDLDKRLHITHDSIKRSNNFI
jgi:5-methylcytosine-specific restriction enzyme subunit McrC